LCISPVCANIEKGENPSLFLWNGVRVNFKIKQYRQAHEAYVRERYLSDGINNLSMYCATSVCPILAAYWFCREIDPENEELTRRIESVKLFYGIEEVGEE
jgi:hypothetical protein